MKDEGLSGITALTSPPPPTSILQTAAHLHQTHVEDFKGAILPFKRQMAFLPSWVTRRAEGKGSEKDQGEWGGGAQDPFQKTGLRCVRKGDREQGCE